MKHDGLNLRQSRFVDEYILNGGNGKRAALVAGCSPASAESQASVWLKNRKVSQAIERERNRLAARADVKKETVVEHCRRIAFANLGDVLDWDGETLTVKSFDDIPEDIHPAIESIKQTERTFGDSDAPMIVKTLEVKLIPKIPAIQELNRILGYHAPTKMQVDDQRVHLHIYTTAKAVQARTKQMAVEAKALEAGEPQPGE